MASVRPHGRWWNDNVPSGIAGTAPDSGNRVNRAKTKISMDLTQPLIFRRFRAKTPIIITLLVD